MPETGPFGIEIRHVVLATGAISVLAVLIILLLNWPARSADSESIGDEPVRNEWADSTLLQPADEFSGTLELEWIPYRPRETRWDDDRLREHWIDPGSVGRELLDERVESRVDDILQGVP